MGWQGGVGSDGGVKKSFYILSLAAPAAYRACGEGPGFNEMGTLSETCERPCLLCEQVGLHFSLCFFFLPFFLSFSI